jgi:hypothetical protein
MRILPWAHHAKPKVVEFRLLYNCKPVLLYKRRSKG